MTVQFCLQSSSSLSSSYSSITFALPFPSIIGSLGGFRSSGSWILIPLLSSKKSWVWVYGSTTVRSQNSDGSRASNSCWNWMVSCLCKASFCWSRSETRLVSSLMSWSLLVC
ncbi:hypothetical protein PanWU01x14_335400 [Parasponia andersonii]|uniref:Uncharacterized protein n=1 Tax=Parasponia andersonii TaxID=3476 RepID=A0A2P5AG87_PARAD|nr:hypothetical protein PanWU01x14_335400 [Parasponia andersonii]